MNSEFDLLLKHCADLASEYPESLTYIGGIAVYLHAINTPEIAHLAEATHDADLVISLADLGDLRDQEELTPNRSLGKQMLLRGGFEFDIYTERQSSLIVPYDVIRGHAVEYGGLRVAALEHLLALKVEAYIDRQRSTKGIKDGKDIYRIALVAELKGGFDCRLALQFLNNTHLAAMDAVLRSQPIALSMTHGNAEQTKAVRTTLSDLLDDIKGCDEEMPSM